MKHALAISLVVAVVVAVVFLVGGNRRVEEREFEGLGSTAFADPPAIAAGAGGSRESDRAPAIAASVDNVRISGVLERASSGGWPLDLEHASVHFTRNTEERSARVGMDEAWEAELTHGRWNVRVVCDGRFLEVIPSEIAITETVDWISLSWIPAPAIEGRVVDCFGNGIGRVGVELIATMGDASDGVTNVDGSFALPADPGVSYRVELDARSLPPGRALPWWQSGGDTLGKTRLFSVGGSSNAPAEIVLGASYVAHARVVDANGTPFSNAVLSLRPRRDETGRAIGANYVVRTDEWGRFEQPLAYGDYEAWLIPARVNGRDVARPDPVEFSVSCDGTDPDLLLEFDKGLGVRSISGTAHTSSGEPILAQFGIWRLQPGLAFESRVHFAAKGSASTDAEGAWEIRGLPADEFLVVRTPSVVPRTDRTYVDAAAYLVVDTRNGDAIVDWTVDEFVPGTIFGHVAIESESDWTQVTAMFDAFPSEYRARVHSDGSYSIDGLPPGDGVLTLAGFKNGASELIDSVRISVLPGTQLEVDFP